MISIIGSLKTFLTQRIAINPRKTPINPPAAPILPNPIAAVPIKSPVPVKTSAPVTTPINKTNATIAVPSFNNDSPSISVPSFLLAPKSFSNATTATGSVALTTAPKSMDDSQIKAPASLFHSDKTPPSPPNICINPQNATPDITVAVTMPGPAK